MDKIKKYFNIWILPFLLKVKGILTWDKKNPELRKYDWIISVLVVFILIYTSYTIVTIQKKVKANKESIVRVELTSAIPTNNLVKFSTSQTNHSLVINTDTSGSFLEGEVVGVKHLGVLAIILNKTFGFEGYTYNIIYKDNQGTLQVIDIEAWMLYHPLKEQLTPYYPLN